MGNGTYVMVVAAGRGSRAQRDNCDLPKQYVSLNGQPILQRILSKFHSLSCIDGILPVIHSEDEELFSEISLNIGDKLLSPVYGGDTRQISVFNGLKALDNLNQTNQVNSVLIHDGARPCFSDDLIQRILQTLDDTGSVCPALRITDTLKRTDNFIVTETVDRSGLWRAQTPQAFHFPLILDAHRAALEVPQHRFTDDCSIAEWHGLDVKVVAGEDQNIKITTPEDFKRGEQILNDMLDVRVGHGFDVHAFEEGSEITLCGVTLPFDKSLKGHSDADVGLHALTDAIYGALGVGDIGTHFPPSDEKWKGTPSDVFLKAASGMATDQGARITHVDVTLICEAPKIGPHSEMMRQAIAKIIKIEPSRVSVKATTTERLGFTGRGEGISALATATLVF